MRPSWPQNNREKAKAIRSTLLLHFLPPRVRIHSLRVPASFGLGVIAVYLFGILCVSGFLLMVYYTPSVERAYDDMKTIIHVVPWGSFTRNAHRWAAHLMVVFTMLHMVRVFCTGAYKKTRKFNWVVGVALMLLTLGLSFTGYLLPWDQLSYWAIVVGAGLLDYVPLVGEPIKSLILGADEVGQSALLRFYVLHVIILPAIFAILLALHIWRVRKDGGMAYLEPNTPDEKKSSSEEKVNAWPQLLLRLILLFQITIIMVIVPSLLWDAPLEDLANPY